jgi:hypothetical protein
LRTAARQRVCSAIPRDDIIGSDWIAQPWIRDAMISRVLELGGFDLSIGVFRDLQGACTAATLKHRRPRVVQINELVTQDTKETWRRAE